MKIKRFNESSNQVENLATMISSNERKQVKLALLLLKSEPEYIEDVAKRVLEHFVVEREYSTFDIISDKNSTIKLGGKNGIFCYR